MTFAVSIIDLFSFAVPGAVHLSILIYVLLRLGVLDPAALTAMPTPVLVVAAVVASYLLGHLCHPLGSQLERLPPRWSRSPDAAQEGFLRRVPQARDRAYVRADPALLLAAAEIHDKEAATEIARMRAQSLMLRNIALAAALVTVVALAELIPDGHRLVAAAVAVLAAIGAVSALREGRKLWHVSRLKTLEICFWIPDIDRRFAEPVRE
ncbi:hypothetical protein [Sciscionella marina]|uniref:hypothetical protein n=1 Tax=Sciscionella marina TaxID=508770 RepID=UPI000377D181|nr:hypothetical protein [Sciscionella marina]